MRLLKFFTIVTTLLGFSCSVQRTGSISSGPLLSINDKYVGMACGETKAKIGGFKDYSREKLINEAKINMYKNRPLKQGEYYSNHVLNIEIREFNFFKGRITISICADILSQNHQKDSLPFSNQFIELISPALKNSVIINDMIFKTGEIIYINIGDEPNECVEMEIVAIQGNTFNLRYLNKTKSNEIVDYSKYEIYSMSKTLDGFQNGDKVSISSTVNKEKSINGKVLAANEKKVVVSSEVGIFSYLPSRLKK